MATVLLLRHGRTSANASGVLAGWTPGVELDDRGRDQADALGARLADAPLALVVTSPLIRCRQTAERVVAARASAGSPVPVREDERLGECRYGSWTGRPLKELASEPLWRTVQNQPSAARFPDGDDYPGESLRDMAARAVNAIRQIDALVEAEHGPSALWAAVSHGDVIKAIVADAAGTPLDLFQRYLIDPASLSVVRYTTARPFLVRFNDTGTAPVAPPAPPQHDHEHDDEHGEPAPEIGDAPVGGGAGPDERGA